MAPKESRISQIVEYDEGRLWFQEKGNVLTIGITLGAVDELGTVDQLDLPIVGDDFDKEAVVCEVKGEGDSIEVITPAAGFVTEINEALTSDLTILNEDPIDEGWLVKIEMQDESDLTAYL